MNKFFALLLSGVLLFSTVPTDLSYAAVLKTVPASKSATTTSKDIAILPGPSGSTTQPTNEALESAIKSVKAKITVPPEYSDFNYSFYNTNSYIDSYWNMTWTNPTDQSYIQVNCDQNNHITSYTNYKNTNKNNNIPVYRKKELKDTADKFINQIAPEISTKLKYIDAVFDGVYSGNYIYNYQRIENGIALPENTVNISVNSATGEVNSASITWLYDVAVPSADVTLTKDEASKLIKKNMEMKLTYHSNDVRIYAKTTTNNTTTKKALLFYEPSKNYISIDAKTGKVYLTKNEWIDENSDVTSAKKEAAPANGTALSKNDSSLTVEEISKLEELKSLITKENAIKAVTSNKYLYFDKNLTSFSANLSKSNYDMSKTNGYVWNIQMSDPREISKKKNADNYRAYASAQVDAKTGKILSFYSSIKSLYNDITGKWNTAKITYNKSTCQKNLEKFLNSQMKNRFELTNLSDTNKDYIAYYKRDNVPVFGGYNYNYNRINEGVEYPYNNIYGAVDGITGKIYNFNFNWDDSVIFESKNGAITSDQAMDDYLGKDGYHLIYEINVINKLEKNTANITYGNMQKVNYEIRLVYCPDINPNYISPFTGEQLNYNGEIYQKAKSYSYLDVTDTAENKEILLLADMNIGFDGQYFYPKNEITYGELTELMKLVGVGYNEADDSKKANKITREQIAQSFITQLGLKDAASLKGIYKTGYADEQSIGDDYLGAVALAKGLGLMQGDSNNNFNPKSNITRAEAVHLIFNFIKVQQAQIYS